MGNTKTASLKFLIAGDARGPGGAQTAMRGVSREADGLTSKAKKVAGLFTAGAVVAWGRQAISTYRTVGGEMLKIQRLTGVTDQAASGIWVAAQQSGVSVEKLTGAVAIFQSKLQKGQLDQYGLGLTDATGKAIPFDEALRKISDRITTLSASERVDLARNLFGKSGADLLPLLLKGGDALDEFIAKAEKMGLTLNSEDIKEATRNQRDFQLATTSAGFVIGKELLPAATAFTSWGAKELPRVVGWVTTVGNAIGGLPGPLKMTLAGLLLLGPASKVLGFLATPFKLIGTLTTSGRAGLDMFRLGLAGVTEKGAGAANAMGGFISSIGPAGVAAGVAGLGLIALAVTDIQIDAARAKQNVHDLQQQIESGTPPGEAALAKLANTIAGVEGGFSGLGGSSDDFRSDLEKYGVTVGRAGQLITGSKKDFDAWAKSLREANPGDMGTERLIMNLDRMRTATDKAVTSTEIHKELQAELGTETSDTADATDESTGSLDRHTEALERANTAVSDLRRKQKDLHSAERAVADAHDESRQALEDLATARRAAAGDSEEYRDAVADIRSAEEGVADAQQKVDDAVRSADQAQRDLNDTRAEAKQRLLDMAQATRDAALAEEEAKLRVAESQQELERKLRDPKASELEKERARLELRKAQEAARQAGEDNASQQAKNAAAQAAGVEGDREVIRARQGVADANRAVSDAERDLAGARGAVAAAEKKAAKVITDARADVDEAVKRSREAVIKEAEAWEDVFTAQKGPLEGAKAYRDFLADLYRTLDPSSPLAQRVAQLMTDINKALAAGLAPPASAQPGGGSTGTIGYTGNLGGDERPGGGSGSNARTGSDAPAPAPEIHLHLSGTPEQQNRAARHSAREALDDWAASTR